MKQTVILALYLNIGDMSNRLATEHCSYVANALNENDKFEDIHVEHYIIPIRDGESRVECIYPSIVADDSLKEKYTVTIDRLNTYLNNCIDSNKSLEE